MNRNQVLGQARIKVDGELFETDKQATLDLGGTMREAVQGDYQAGAFTAGTKESKLDCSILLKAGTNVARLRDIDNATITFEADTGQVFIIRNAYSVEPPVINQSEGKAAISFQGPPAEEMA